MGCGASTPTNYAAAPGQALAPVSAGATSASGGAKKVVALHFNDVYNLEPGKKEPVGGAAKFAGMLAQQTDDPIVLFSGDALNPSMASTFFKGKQMIPVLNALKCQAACVGNHDLDFGVENLQQCMKESHFPWLLANIIEKETDKPLAGAEPTGVIDHHGVRVGLIGLAEQEWITTLATVQEEQLIYEDFVPCCKRYAAELRADGCEVIIALTHMREPNDDKLARECAADIDAVLGGHDHHYVAKSVEGVPVLKSGTEFRWASKAIFEVPAGGGRPKVSWETIEVKKDTPDDPEMAKIVKEVEEKLGESMDVEIGENVVDLEGRFLWVRTRETNLGNLVCDLLRIASGADVCILNGGTLRSDMVHKPGKILFRDLVKILPLLDETCVLEMKGKDIKTALENACSQYPKLEGRFAQVSGLSYTFDADKPVGERVVRVEIPIGTPMVDEKLYKVNTKEYLSKGKDGYDIFKNQKVLRSGEEAPIIPTTMRNHLLTLEVLNTMSSGALGSQKSVHERAANSFKKKLKTHSQKLMEQVEDEAKKGGSKLAMKHPLTGRLCLGPSTEGRIITLNPADESKMTR